MLKVRNVSCGYDGIDVVKNAALDCRKGECVTIVGPNGCGKTTLLRAIAGLLPYTGSVLINNQELSRLKRRDISKEIALMTQVYQIYFSYSVYETVALGRYLHLSKNIFNGLAKSDDEVVLQCLENVGLLDIKDKDITTLSGGQLQRVFLARVFAQEPKIILLDEPTNHLDLKHQIDLVERLQLWVAEGERGIIGVFHDLNLSMNLSQKTVLMDKGEVVEYGNTAEVLQSETLEKVYGIDVKSYMQNSFKNWGTN